MPLRPESPLGPHLDAESPLWAPHVQLDLQRVLESVVSELQETFLEVPPAVRFPAGEGNRLERTFLYLSTEYMALHKLKGRFHFEEGLPSLAAPESLLRVLFEHLVEGSLRDNPAPKPFCHVGVLEAGKTHVTLYFRDNGVPLPECTIEQVRDFVNQGAAGQAPPRVLRLLQAHSLVQWMNGNLTLGPGRGDEGATVHVRLPKAFDPKKVGPSPFAGHVF